jgi:hypothetical protein
VLGVSEAQPLRVAAAIIKGAMCFFSMGGRWLLFWYFFRIRCCGQVLWFFSLICGYGLLLGGTIIYWYEKYFNSDRPDERHIDGWH